MITDLSGNIADGGRRPSSELNLHAAFYRAKPEARSVVHTPLGFLHHSGQTGRAGSRGALHDWRGQLPEIPLAPYVTFGTEELADVAVRFCGGSEAVMLANHGLVTCGGSLADA